MAEHDNTMRELTVKLKKLKLSQSTALEEYLEGKIHKSELQARKAKSASLILETEEHLASLDAHSGDTLELVEQHRPFYEQDSLTRDMVKELVKEVRISSPTEIEIVWKFQECYTELEQGFMPKLNYDYQEKVYGCLDTSIFSCYRFNRT